MKRLPSLLFTSALLFSPVLAFAQKERTAEAEVSFTYPSDITLREAKRRAVEEAKAEAKATAATTAATTSRKSPPPPPSQGRGGGLRGETSSRTANSKLLSLTRLTSAAATK